MGRAAANDQDDPEAHDVAGVRGCLFGLVISAVFWVIVVVVVVVLVRR
jgi:uncharacterized membrane protein